MAPVYTDSTMIRFGGPWGRLKRALLARFDWRPRPVGATPRAPSLIKCCCRCFDKPPAGDHKTTLTLFCSLCLQSETPSDGVFLFLPGFARMHKPSSGYIRWSKRKGGTQCPKYRRVTL
ncbi:hypothetical protein [Desulforamulus hydrothermalis]|uniref:hypothetical protein n=1 Tax=Desulforamulus hydrothermalis TaxID=412895 RepID=UPI001F24CB5B|nr:hypothetical protein [Desulforamulus hydrothermalis]